MTSDDGGGPSEDEAKSACRTWRPLQLGRAVPEGLLATRPLRRLRRRPTSRSYVDLFDPSTEVKENRVDVYTLGFNVFFAETTKFQLNVNRRDDRTSTEGATHEVLAQLQGSSRGAHLL